MASRILSVSGRKKSSIGGPDVPAMPFSPPMEDFFLPDTDRVLDAMRSLAAY